MGREYYPFLAPLGASYPGSPSILEAFLTGETALRVAQQGLEITKRQIVEVLQSIYGDRVTEPVDIIQHDFITNPYFYGDFSAELVGVTDQTYENMAAPAGRLYFSGEAATTQFTTAVQGAYFSGIEGASAILQDIREGKKDI